MSETSDVTEDTTPVKYFNDQFDDESVLYVFRKHPIAMRKGILLWAVGILLGPLYILLLTLVYRNDPSKFPDTTTFFIALGASFLLSLLLFAPSLISWYFSLFIMTDQRFIQITQKGLFHRTVADCGLEQIQSINYEIAGFNETVLGFGTIKMQTYIGDMVIHEIHHPAHVQRRLVEILRQEGFSGPQSIAQTAQNSNRTRNE